jgi:transposase-like protein
MGLARITRNMVCPVCGVDDFTRVHRAFWMRWLHGSRRYRCRHCRSEILLVAPPPGAADKDATRGEARG